MTRLFHADAAARLGLAASTWRDYYSDRRTPKPDGFTNDRGFRRPWWKPETLDAWQATRPRRGARTEITLERLDND